MNIEAALARLRRAEASNDLARIAAAREEIRQLFTALQPPPPEVKASSKKSTSKEK